MKYIKVAILCILLCPIQVLGQVSALTEIENEIVRINNSVLYKAYRVYNGEDMGYTLIEDKNLLKQHYLNADTVYFDVDKKIKKIVFTSEYGQLIGSISYYNNEGNRIFSMEYDVDQGVSVSCKRYLKDGKTFLLIGKIVEELFPDVLTTHVYYRDGEMTTPYTGILSAKYDFLLDNIFNISSLMIPMDMLNDSIKLVNCVKVKFESPCLFDTTVVNSYNVNIRNKPGTKEQIIDTIFQQGHPVIVLEKLFEEKNMNLNTYPWYKIKYNKYYWRVPDKTGYIYGKYLDPVEKIID